MSEMETALRIRPITVDEYHRMVEVGILYEREPVELLDGQLIEMPSEGPVHADVVATLNAELVQRFAGRAVVRPANPIELSATSEPQPDFTLARVRPERYLAGHPRPADVFLVVEVSRTSLSYDRGVKLRAYARGGIAEVWIVDLVHGHVETFAEPHELGYASSGVVGRDGSVAPRAFPGDAIPVAAFLP